MGSHRLQACLKDKYLNAIETHRIRIFEVYLRYEQKKPVMLFLPRRGQVPGDTFWYLRSREK